MTSLILENRQLRNKVHRLEKENQALRRECAESCHEVLIESMRQKYDVPLFLLSKTSYEILQNKDFKGIEEFMLDRARMFQGNKPKLVSKEAKV